MASTSMNSPACVENSGKYGYDAAGNRSKADEAQDKQEGDADGMRILLRTITARITMTLMR